MGLRVVEKLDFFSLINRKAGGSVRARRGEPWFWPWHNPLELSDGKNPKPRSGRLGCRDCTSISDFQPLSPKPQLSERDPFGSSTSTAEQRGLRGYDSPNTHTHITTRRGSRDAVSEKWRKSKKRKMRAIE